MLIGFVGQGRESEEVERVALGGEVLCVGLVSIWARANEGHARIDPGLSAGIEGHLELSPDTRDRHPLSVDALRSATGDFAVMAATPAGLLVGSGFAGGHRPVYVSRLPGGGAIASTQLEPLLSALSPRPRPDPEFAASRAILEAPLAPTATPYVGIQKVPHGEAWLLGEGRLSRERLNRPQRDAEARGSGQELAMMLREALEASLLRTVKETTRRIGIAVSGGLDSAMLAALACSLAKKGALRDLPAIYHWQSESPFPEYRDEPHFQSLLRHLGIQATEISLAEVAEDFRNHLVVDGAPCAFPGQAFWTALGRHATRQGQQMVVSGAGGDQVMEGQPWLFGDLALSGHPVLAIRCAVGLRGFEVGHLAARFQLVFRPAFGRFLPPASRRARRRSALRHRYPWAGPRLREHLEARAEILALRPTLDWSPRERYDALISHRMFEGDQLWGLRAQEQLVGGHVRADPFLDDGFLRFVATLPPLALLHGNYCRGLLREAMRGLVPDDVRLRETKAGLVPALVKTINLLGGFRIFRHLTDARMMADLGLVEPKAFRARFEKLAEDPIRQPWLDVWPFLSIESFLRQCSGEPDASLIGARA